MPSPAAVAAVPATRAYRTTVARVSRLSAHFVRVTVAGESLVDFGPSAARGPDAAERVPAWDQRVKLFLPRADGTYPQLGLFDEPAPTMMEWYTAWRQLPDEERNPIRTYTVRSARPLSREVDVDFVLHEEPDGSMGPAASWAASAAVGDELIVIGPDRRSEQAGGGIEWNPGTAREVMLAGDETAAPAICGILESLAASDEARVFFGEAYIEVPTADDVLDVNPPSGVVVRWLPRDGAPLGELLGAAVQDWGRRRSIIFEARRAAWAPGLSPVGAPAASKDYRELAPEDPVWEVAEPEGFREYAWLAGESGVITGLRRHLVKEIGLSRGQVSFMGYWKQGRPSA
ncbi:siderophore-interacting protein [Nesterenkonia sp. NBAIMH1]|uniref:siderophore-interacting protein n=1 Tax=Nesterenkonia sp. NBAIMH1 TaxID=2600320 RepID=UPI0011B6D015|nr:siderophore-interacting protein [Nesterenkonia sp. NBAIMH1]